MSARPLGSARRGLIEREGAEPPWEVGLPLICGLPQMSRGVNQHRKGAKGSKPREYRDMPASDDTADDEIEWLSTPGAAERLGITSRTLYRFIDEGQLPAFKFGRVIRLKKSDVDAYIESCRVEPGSMSHLYPETTGSGDG